MFFIRADGNAEIGAGHIMRCLTVATELKKLQGGDGEEICFLCAQEPSAELVRKYGFRAQVLDTDYEKMEEEIPKLVKIFEDYREKPMILVDSYRVTDAYLEALGGFGRVVLMDDLGQKKYPVKAVVNYNAPADRAVYEELYRGDGVTLLLGGQYTPLREQFRGKNYEVRPVVQNVMITTGGGDSLNLAGKILEKLYRENMDFHLIVGQFNPFFAQLKQLEKEHHNIFIHDNVTDMAGRMTAVDLAITAGGSTVYELAALGVPFICFSYAENQEPLTEFVGQREVAGFAGAYHKASEETLENMKEQFARLCGDLRLRRMYHEREKALIDGRGATRLAAALLELKK